MTTTAQKIELLAKANDTHKLLEQARQRADFDSCARLCDVLQHEYTLLKLMEKQEQEEAAWSNVKPDQPDPFSFERVKSLLGYDALK